MKNGAFAHIAVIASGMNEEYQSNVLNGIIKAGKEQHANIACFSAFSGAMENNMYDTGENNIFSLMKTEQFDGIILLANTIDHVDVRREIIERIEKSGVPTVVFDHDSTSSFYNICIDNAAAMRSMVTHLIEVHHAKDLYFISGPMSNPEAAVRYQAFCDVMQQYHLPWDDSHVYYGNFHRADGKYAVEQLLDSGMPLPDAIIGANDAMAMEAISVLNEQGIRVPEDVIVTGFDAIIQARHYSPVLTTVERPLEEAGILSCNLLMKILRGESCEKTIRLTAKPIFHESCGCQTATMEGVRAYKKNTYEMVKQMRADVSLLNRMTSALAEIETADEYVRVVGKFIRELGCEMFSICLCEDWKSIFSGSYKETEELERLVHGYSVTMSAPLIWQNQSVTNVESFQSRDMYPIPPVTGGNVSFFLPLHFREHCLGYFVIQNGDFPIRSMLCHTLLMNLSHSLESIRKISYLNHAIEELDRLYVLDPLCNINNRNGFIRQGGKMFRQCVETGEAMLIAFVDMDGLKYVNDHFGHDEGDFALRQLASIIKGVCTEKQVCARFGGDEFILLGTNATEQDAVLLEQRFNEKLTEMNGILHKPYELAASIGAIVTKVTSDMKLFALISQADQVMYEQKKRRQSRYLRRD